MTALEMAMMAHGLGGGSGIHQITSTTGTNNYIATHPDIESYMTPALLAEGKTLVFISTFSSENTGPVTYNINGLGDRIVLDPSSVDLSPRAITENSTHIVIDTGHVFKLLSTQAVLTSWQLTTNMAGFTSGRLLPARLPTSATANRLLKVGTANTDPFWGQAELTTDVAGILPQANGGTGRDSFVAALTDSLVAALAGLENI